MKTFTYNVTRNSLKEMINTNDFAEIIDARSILVQIFSGEKITKVQHLLKELHTLFKNLSVIGATTDGEISNATVTTKNTIVSISIFEKTDIKSFYTDVTDDFNAGVIIAKEIVTKNSQLLLSFADGLLTNGEEYLNGIFSIEPNVMVAGGLSGDNANFKECYIIHNKDVYQHGAVAITLNSDILQVKNFHNFGWDKIGLEHTITKVEKNRVFTIDNMTTVDFYKKYLGEEVANDLPATAIEFPLIRTDENNIDIARAALNKYDDHSLSFAGNFQEGEKISLGIGNSSKILSHNIIDLKNIDQFSVESFFIYSCMARRRFMLDLSTRELQPYANIAPTSGFFTYGEFFTKKKPTLLNETLTAISLSENSNTTLTLQSTVDQNLLKSAQYKTYRAISHLIAQTVEEYNILNNKLEHKVHLEKLNNLEFTSKYQLLIDSMSEGMIICDNNYQIADTNSATLQLLGYSKQEIINKKITDFASTKSREKMLKCIQSGNNKQRLKITLIKKDGTFLSTLISQKTIELRGKTMHMAIIIDISEMLQKDKQLLIQSKFAQMGEMINMIAHQWRQPLNAISATAIQINMKNKLNLLETKDIQKGMQFIQDSTQKMSKTINDFMNFSKSDSANVKINLYELFQEVLNLIKAQLIAHNIEVELIVPKQLTLLTKKQELAHILINLLVNARDALDESTQQNKKIIISATTVDEHCNIKVLDNAGGVPADIIDRVFELYFTTKEQGKGTGLGLYMSKKLAHEFLDAELLVENREFGAEFTLLFRNKKGDTI